MNIEDISEEEFERYEDTRRRGRFNMFDSNARLLTGLSKEIYFGVMEHYTALSEKFQGVRE